MSGDAPYFVAVGRAAEQVGKSERVLRDWVASGQVRSCRVGHSLMVELSDVVRAEARQFREVQERRRLAAQRRLLDVLRRTA